MALLPMLAAVAAATVAPLTPDSTVGALAAHPVLAPVAKRLMPWDNRPVAPGLPLSRVGELMPWHTLVSPEAIVGARDGIAPARVVSARAEALRAAGVPTECRIVPAVGHGFGLGSGSPAEGWMAAAVAFWERFLNDPQRKD